MNERLNFARDIIRAFLFDEISSAKAELDLLELGFYDVTFTPTASAKYLGITYNLEQ
jgi:hypothetical protein